ncbi:MAG: Dps family protein [Flavobacteriales bacterium]
MMTNQIGLPNEEVKQLQLELNALLANFQLYYQNLRGFHWNIKGRHFFELHVKFEELYNDSQEKIDLIAERILTLNHQPLHTFKDYIKYSEIKSAKNMSSDRKIMKHIMASLQTLIILERKILNTASDIEDEGTTAMMSDFIGEQEKTVWMLNAWLKN